jgi:RHS repeat-associated protein
LGREYDGYGRVVRELAPASASSDSPKVTVYGYDSSSRLATVSSNGSSCFSESYSYNSRGDRTSSSIGVCGATTTKTNSFNSESQLTTSGYVYDALGRNTFIPAVDAPANNAGIHLAYSLVDQVAGITQSGLTTSFTYDALGRRVNETVGNQTTIRHYSDSSDTPEWTTQQSGANLTTEIYTGSLGAGLAVTTTFKGTLRTSAMQLTDIRGHTVTTLDLDSNSVAGWSVYDSFGNPQNSQTSTNLINYSSYSQQERATNSTGLILMGARVYNPETNQFTSKDPIKGGNENSYTYPNDPVNGSDFTGLNFWFDIGVMVVGALVTSAICAATAGIGCLVGSIVVGAVGGFMKAGVKIKEEKIPKSKIWATLGEGMLYGAFEAVKGAAVGRVVSKVLSKSKKIETFSKTRRGSWALEISQDLAIDASLEYLPKGVEYVSEFVKNSMKKKK